MKTVCIIGGGASALMCACFVKDDTRVTIIEQNDKIGKKILATGNGRCNLSNLYINKYSYNTDLSDAFKKFSIKDTLNFFKNIGLETYFDEQGRVYPLSNSATSVLEVLKNYLQHKPNINIVTGENFCDIEKYGDKFKILYGNNVNYFDKVVVATGNRTNLSIFEKFNLQFKQFKPSLCALKTSKNKLLAGQRFSNVNVICKNVGFEETGEILFREDGISGIVVFNLSAFLARNDNYCEEILIDFLPNLSLNELIEKLKTRQYLLKNYKIDDFLTGFFHKSLNFQILKLLNINVNDLVKNLSTKTLEKIANEIKNYKLTTSGYLNNNQICAGGIDLNNLDENLQAKRVKNMYFIGEVIDVDGICGGYNLQWAWTSGKIVGETL